MFKLTIEFDLIHAPKLKEELISKEVNIKHLMFDSFVIEHKSNFVPRIGDYITHHLDCGPDFEDAEINGEVEYVNMIIDAGEKESFYITVHCEDDEN